MSQESLNRNNSDLIAWLKNLISSGNLSEEEIREIQLALNELMWLLDEKQGEITKRKEEKRLALLKSWTKPPIWLQSERWSIFMSMFITENKRKPETRTEFAEYILANRSKLKQDFQKFIENRRWKVNNTLKLQQRPKQDYSDFYAYIVEQREKLWLKKFISLDTFNSYIQSVVVLGRDISFDDFLKFMTNKELSFAHSIKSPKVDQTIKNQWSNLAQWITEIVANAIDAYHQDNKISRFWQWFYQSLNFLAWKDDLLTVKTKKQWNNWFEVQFRNIIWVELSTQNIEKEWIWTEIELKRKLSQEEIKDLQDFIKLRFRTTEKVDLYLNWELINSNWFTKIDWNIYESDNKPRVDVNIWTEWFKVIDNWIWMDSKTIATKLIYPKKKNNKFKKLSDKETKEKVPNEVDLKVKKWNSPKSNVRLQIAGVCIEEFEFEKSWEIDELIMELPSFTWLPDSRNTIVPTRDIVFAMEYFMNYINTQNISLQTKLDFVSLIWKIAKRINQRPTDESKNEHNLSFVMKKWFEQYKNKITESWKIVLPYSQDLFSVFSWNENIVFVWEEFVSLNLESIPGIKRMINVVDNTKPFYEIEFPENFQESFIETNSWVLVNSRYTKDEKSVNILNVSLNLKIYWEWQTLWEVRFFDVSKVVENLNLEWWWKVQELNKLKESSKANNYTYFLLSISESPEQFEKFMFHFDRLSQVANPKEFFINLRNYENLWIRKVVSNLELLWEELSLNEIDLWNWYKIIDEKLYNDSGEILSGPPIRDFYVLADWSFTVNDFLFNWKTKEFKNLKLLEVIKYKWIIYYFEKSDRTNYWSEWKIYKLPWFDEYGTINDKRLITGTKYYLSYNSSWKPYLVFEYQGKDKYYVGLDDLSSIHELKEWYVFKRTEKPPETFTLQWITWSYENIFQKPKILRYSGYEFNFSYKLYDVINLPNWDVAIYTNSCVFYLNELIKCWWVLKTEVLKNRIDLWNWVILFITEKWVYDVNWILLVENNSIKNIYKRNDDSFIIGYSISRDIHSSTYYIYDSKLWQSFLDYSWLYFASDIDNFAFTNMHQRLKSYWEDLYDDYFKWKQNIWNYVLLSDLSDEQLVFYMIFWYFDKTDNTKLKNIIEFFRDANNDIKRIYKNFVSENTKYYIIKDNIIEDNIIDILYNAILIAKENTNYFVEMFNNWTYSKQRNFKEYSNDKNTKLPENIKTFYDLLLTWATKFKDWKTKIEDLKNPQIKTTLSQIMWISRFHNNNLKTISWIDWLKYLFWKTVFTDLSLYQWEIYSTIEWQDRSSMIWIREVIQNSLDAILKDQNENKKINIDFFKQDWYWTTSVTDNVWMNLYEVMNYLLVPWESWKQKWEWEWMFWQWFYSLAIWANLIKVKTSKWDWKIIYLEMIPIYSNDWFIIDFDINIEEKNEDFKWTIIERVDEDNSWVEIKMAIWTQMLQRYTWCIEDVDVNLWDEKINKPEYKKFLFWENIPELWELKLFKALDGIERLNKKWLYVSELPENMLSFFPSWIIKILKSSKLILELPNWVELTKSRNAIKSFEDNFAKIKPYLFRIVIKYIINNVKNNDIVWLPVDYTQNIWFDIYMPSRVKTYKENIKYFTILAKYWHINDWVISYISETDIQRNRIDDLVVRFNSWENFWEQEIKEIFNYHNFWQFITWVKVDWYSMFDSKISYIKNLANYLEKQNIWIEKEETEISLTSVKEKLWVTIEQINWFTSFLKSYFSEIISRKFSWNLKFAFWINKEESIAYAIKWWETVYFNVNYSRLKDFILNPKWNIKELVDIVTHEMVHCLENPNDWWTHTTWKHSKSFERMQRDLLNML